jgi:hypothetical protein
MDDQPGRNISWVLQKLSVEGATANAIKLELSLLVARGESGPRVTTEAQQVWKDVAAVLGELQMWLLGPATPTASPSTRS